MTPFLSVSFLAAALLPLAVVCIGPARECTCASIDKKVTHKWCSQVSSNQALRVFVCVCTLLTPYASLSCSQVGCADPYYGVLCDCLDDAKVASSAPSDHSSFRRLQLDAEGQDQADAQDLPSRPCPPFQTCKDNKEGEKDDKSVEPERRLFPTLARPCPPFSTCGGRGSGAGPRQRGGRSPFPGSGAPGPSLPGRSRPF